MDFLSEIRAKFLADSCCAMSDCETRDKSSHKLEEKGQPVISLASSKEIARRSYIVVSPMTEKNPPYGSLSPLIRDQKKNACLAQRTGFDN